MEWKDEWERSENQELQASCDCSVVSVYFCVNAILMSLCISCAFSFVLCFFSPKPPFLQVHCSTVASKFECLLHMCRKLYSFVQGRCVADNADALSSHELLLPGHLFR